MAAIAFCFISYWRDSSLIDSAVPALLEDLLKLIHCLLLGKVELETSRHVCIQLTRDLNLQCISLNPSISPGSDKYHLVATQSVISSFSKCSLRHRWLLHFRFLLHHAMIVWKKLIEFLTLPAGPSLLWRGRRAISSSCESRAAPVSIKIVRTNKTPVTINMTLNTDIINKWAELLFLSRLQSQSKLSVPIKRPSQSTWHWTPILSTNVRNFCFSLASFDWLLYRAFCLSQSYWLVRVFNQRVVNWAFHRPSSSLVPFNGLHDRWPACQHLFFSQQSTK